MKRITVDHLVFLTSKITIWHRHGSEYMGRGFISWEEPWMRKDSGRVLECRYGLAVQQRSCGTTEEVVPSHRRKSVKINFDALDINDGLQRGLISIIAPQNDAITEVIE